MSRRRCHYADATTQQGSPNVRGAHAGVISETVVVRTSVAVAAGKVARAATRLRGGGSAMPGLVVERLDPRFLTNALAGLSRGVVVVTGTNGKTTTTKMLVAILREHGLTVFTNPTGSNFTRGVISSMLAEIP